MTCTDGRHFVAARCLLGPIVFCFPTTGGPGSQRLRFEVLTSYIGYASHISMISGCGLPGSGGAYWAEVCLTKSLNRSKITPFV